MEVGYRTPSVLSCPSLYNPAEGNAPVFMVKERTLGDLSMELSNDKVALGLRDICVKDRNQEKKEDKGGQKEIRRCSVLKNKKQVVQYHGTVKSGNRQEA